MISLKNQYAQLLASFTQAKKPLWSAGGQNQNTGSNLTGEIVTFIITEALICRASDIHLEPRPGKVAVRFRIDGKLHDVLEVEETENINILPRIKILANIPTDSVSSRKSWDGRFSSQISGQKFDFRVATFPTILGDKMAIRIIARDTEAADLKKIGLNAADYARLERIINRKNGLVIVSGPTGGGKTTTLYGMLRRLHTPAVNIVTLEDPVEYQIDGINQCSLKHTGKDDEDFITGLRAVLRQDPDIILIGEMRDAESAEIAMRASITGHLVFSTLHANSSLGSLFRLINMGLERHMVAYAVIGCISQNLARKICDGCRVPYKLDAQAVNRLCAQCGINPKLFIPTVKQSKEMHYLSSDQEASEFTFYKGSGCTHCSGTGYRGRVGIFEVLQVTDNLREAIVNKATMVQLESIAAGEGFQSMVLDAIAKVKAGMVSIDDVYPILLEKSK